MPGLSRAGAGQAKQGRRPRGGRGPGSPYRERAGSSPRLRGAAQPALLPPAPPAPPRLPPRPPPPPAPPRSLIDRSLKKSPRSRAASAGELRHSCNPSAPPGRRSAPARSTAAHPSAAPQPAPRAAARGDLGGPGGEGGGRGLCSPAPRKESTRGKFEQRTKERANLRHFFLRRQGGWGVANSSQMSYGAKAQGLICFQSLKSPSLPTSLFPSAGRCPGRRSQCARFSGRRGGSRRLEGTEGREGGPWLCAAPLSASSARRCRGSCPRPPPPRGSRESLSERLLARSEAAF